MDEVDSKKVLVFKKEKEKGLMKEKAIVDDIYCHEKIVCSISQTYFLQKQTTFSLPCFLPFENFSINLSLGARDYL